MAAGNGAEARSSSRFPPKGDCRRQPTLSSLAPGSNSCRGGARLSAGAIAGLPGIEVAYVSSAEIVGQLAAGAAHFGVAGEDLVREKVADVEARLELLDPARVWPRQCRGRGAQGLDRRAHDGRSRRCCFGLSRQARRAHAGRDQIRQSHPPLLCRAWNRRLPHCREPRRDRGRARIGCGGAHRRHYDDGRDARSQCAQDPRRWNDATLAGDADRLAHRPVGRTRGKPRATSSPASRRARKRGNRARSERGCRARRMSSSRRPPSDSARFRRPARTSIRTGSSRCIAHATKWRSSPAGCSRRAPSGSASRRSNKPSPPAMRCTMRWRAGSARASTEPSLQSDACQLRRGRRARFDGDSPQPRNMQVSP